MPPYQTRSQPPNPIDAMMAKLGLSRWLTVYICLWSLVSVVMFICILLWDLAYGGGALEDFKPGPTFNSVMLTVCLGLTLLMVMLNLSGRDFVPSALKSLGLTAVFYVFCAVAAIFVVSMIYGLLRLFIASLMD